MRDAEKTSPSDEDGSAPPHVLAPTHQQLQFEMVWSEPMDVRRSVATTMFRMRAPKYQFMLWSEIATGLYVVIFRTTLHLWFPDLVLALVLCGLIYDLFVFPLTSYRSLRQRGTLRIGAPIDSNFSEEAITVTTPRKMIRVTYGRLRKITLIRGFVFAQGDTSGELLVLPVELFPADMVKLVRSRL